MSIKIQKPALLMTLVSHGRNGFRSLGIGPGGAMDQFAMNIANYLVGNDEAAVMELGYSSAELFFENESVIAVTGKGYSLQIDQEEVVLWRPVMVKSGATLKLTKTNSGAYAYLSVHRGWKAENWLGSFTTNVNAKAGGFNGRVLQKEDKVECEESKIRIDKTKILSWGISTNEIESIYSPTSVVRCLPSMETNFLASRENLTTRQFVITSQSNRMGYRLKGEPILLKERLELISSPVDFGTIQLLPDGNLIVLMADHQTTGGYPRIASVIKADLPKLAQTMPGEKLNFKMVSFEEAGKELQLIEQKLIEMKQSCHDRFKKYFT